MEYEKALRFLRGGEAGIPKWNRWREKDSAWGTTTGPDLKGIELGGADLRGADLSHADLSNADLREADLRDVNFWGAILRDADLGGSYLRGTNFSHADLTNANLDRATADSTVFLCNVSGAKGLDGIMHLGPSACGPDWLDAFTEELPENFLRGVGFGDSVIAALRADLGAIRFYSCFISYSTADEEFAKRLHADLQDSGVRCWFAPKDMKIGEPVIATIDQAIRLRDKLVVVISETSIGSDWVEHEINLALSEEEVRDKLVLFPLRLDDAVMDCEFGWAKRIRDAHKPSGRHIGNFTNWKDHDAYQAALQRLLRDLQIE